MVEAVQAEPVVDKFASGKAGREGIKLGAVAENTGKLFGLRWSDSQNADGAVGGPDEAGHQIHERGFS